MKGNFHVQFRNSRGKSDLPPDCNGTLRYSSQMNTPLERPRNRSNRRNNAVTRTALDTQLQAIRAKIVQLGTLVKTALEQALQAMQSGNQALCGLVVEQDSMIDELRFE